MIRDLILYTPMFISGIWAIIFLFSSPKESPKFMLGVFMASVFALFSSHSVYYQNLQSLYLYFDLVFIFNALAVYPLYYLYIKVLTLAPFTLKDTKLFIPAVSVTLLSGMVYLLMPAPVRETYIQQYLFGNGSVADADVLIVIQKILCYILQGIYLLQIFYFAFKIKTNIMRYNDRIENYYSETVNKTVHWAKNILYSFVVMSVVCILPNFLGRYYFMQYNTMLIIVAVLFSILLLIFGLLGNLQNYSVSNFETDKESTDLAPSNITTSQNAPISNDLSGHREIIKQNLIKLIDCEKIHTQQDIRINDIAKKLGTNRSYLSQIINQDYLCSFNTFINKYRITEAKKMLADKQYSNLSLEAISAEVGFGSLHSFIRAFKEQEDITPGKYREQNTSL